MRTWQSATVAKLQISNCKSAIERCRRAREMMRSRAMAWRLVMEQDGRSELSELLVSCACGWRDTAAALAGDL